MRRPLTLMLPLFALWFSLVGSVQVASASRGSAATGSSCSAPGSSVFRLATADLANPSATVICRARRALQAHSIITAVGPRSSVGQLGRLLGIQLPDPSITQSISTTQVSQRGPKPATGAEGRQPIASSRLKSHITTVFLGAHLDSKGVVQSYEGLAAAGGETQAAAQFNQWVGAQVAQQAAGQQTAPSSPQPGAWTDLNYALLNYSDPWNDAHQFAITYYRLNDLNIGADWYLFATHVQTTPNYSGCNYTSCGVFTNQRNLTIPGPISLFDHGPTGTITSSTDSFTVGTSLNVASDVGAGVDASYSQSWNTQAVTTTDQTSGNTAAWQENFTGPNYSAWPFGPTPPPPTSTGTFISYQAAIFIAGEGTSSFNLTPVVVSKMELDNNFHLCFPFLCYTQNFLTTTLSVPLTIQPPAFSVSPSALQLTSGSSGGFSIAAYVPNSAQNLAWDVTNIPSWLTVSSLSGAGFSSVKVIVARRTPRGSVAYLNFNTSPAFAAPSVESGPIVVTVTVVKK